MNKQTLRKKYEGLQRDELYQSYYDLSNQTDRHIKDIKKEKFVIQEIIDEMEIKETNDFHSYPDYNEPDFIKKISEKAEFFHQKNIFDEKNLDKSCSPSEFELGKHQEFLRNFMNENTPYKGIMVFHGVGVGKTCTAITISNSFRDIYRRKHKKILCLVSENIKPGWMNQIYDPTKGTNQCTGDSFHSLVSNLDTVMYDTDLKKEKKTKKMIKEFYEFFGYGKFSNMVSKMIQQAIGNRELSSDEIMKKEKQVIQSYFSDRLLIIDEAHNLRDENDSVSRDVLINLYKVIKYSKNLRLVLLSATPLYNQPTEITWMLNLLLKNDNRPTLRDRDLFTKQGELTDDGKQLLYKKSRGYISYLRGENPVSFPIRLFPDNNLDPSCNPKEVCKFDLWGKPIPDYERLVKLYKTKFGSIQKLVYESYRKSMKGDTKISPMERRTANQISNMVYPVSGLIKGGIQKDKIIPKEMYGDTGLRRIMEYSVKNKGRKYKYKDDYLKEFPIPCFHRKAIGLYSGKIKNIVSGIQKSKGIVFIYSEYLSSGLVPLALALEHAGYGKYNGKDLWDYPQWKPGGKSLREQPIDSSGKRTSESNQAKYIILSGDMELSPNNQSEIKALVSDKNKYGDTIKIILGNVVASEGLDLKNIREIHILEPWFHLFRLEQIIGRGIRRCSHKELPKEERNVTVYHHVGYIHKDYETIDIETYRLAEKKAKSIGNIETILKENAIDCYLNKGSNVIHKKNVQSRQLLTSRGVMIDNYDVSDKPFSKLCSYQKNCNYSCGGGNFTIKNVNFDTFSIENSKRMIKTIQTIITELFSMNNFYTLNELEKSITDIIDCNQRVIYLAISDMIQNKLSIWNDIGMEGYLLKKHPFYLFQPKNNTDEVLPLYYRQTIESPFINQTYSLEDIFPKIMPKQELVKVDKSINELYKEICLIDVSDKQKTTFIFQKKSYNFHSIIHLDVKVILSHILDTLSYRDKTKLLKHILQKKVPVVKLNYNQEVPFREELVRLFRNKDELQKHILYYFRYNLIKKHKQQYYIGNDEKYEIVGFFICNSDTLQSNKGKELDTIMDNFDYYIYQDEWKHISEMETGKIILLSLTKNFLKQKDTIPLFTQTHKFWGFSFTSKDKKHMLKVTDNKRVKNKIPGLIMNNEAHHDNIKKVIQALFPDEYSVYESQIDETNQKKYNSKLFLCLLLEMLLRSYHEDTQNKTYYLSYDLFLLKLI